MMKCGLVEPKENTMARYIKGWRPSISNVMQLQMYWSLLDIQTLDLKVEK